MNKTQRFGLIRRRFQQADSRGFGLLAVVFSMLALSAMGLGVTSMISSGAATSTADQDGQKAFFVAEGGLSHTLTKEFMSDMNYSNNTSATGAPYGGTPITLGDGQFWVQYSNQTETTADVTVTARVGSSVRVLKQSVSMAIPVTYPVYGSGNIEFNGTMPPGQDLDGALYGDIAAGGDITFGNHFIYTGTAHPHLPMSLPAVNTARLATEITTTTHNGNLTVPSGYFNQKVHVSGNVTIESGAVIDGHIIADGDMSINGTVSATGTLAAVGNITGVLAANSSLVAQAGPNQEVLPVLQAGGNLSLSDVGMGTVITGIIITGGNTTLTSNLPSPERWETSVNYTGGILSGGNITVNNERGFIVVNGDPELMTSFAQGGNLKLGKWQEN
ncbi:MAG: hypothetical protein A2Y02_03010 [Omnitrophica bacterium GWA2_52_12]|nr:MAG: hypothetical protein A2Y02_03010 [Omnitrophica bacterium GWA2_52_12]